MTISSKLKKLLKQYFDLFSQSAELPKKIGEGGVIKEGYVVISHSLYLTILKLLL
jgi:hypothetical protein